jgi:hypothetical protein
MRHGPRELKPPSPPHHACHRPGDHPRLTRTLRALGGSGRPGLPLPSTGSRTPAVAATAVRSSAQTDGPSGEDNPEGPYSLSAGRGTRTPKGSLPEVFETSASTTSAIPAAFRAARWLHWCAEKYGGLAGSPQYPPAQPGSIPLPPRWLNRTRILRKRWREVPGPFGRFSPRNPTCGHGSRLPGHWSG